jgi:sugar phosphate isomerase/epimerase
VKFAICNELFENWPFADVCRCVAEIGYTGLELAPFTLAPSVTELSSARRAELRRQAGDAGLEIVGLHWLLARTTGYHVTSPDAAVRRRTAEYLAELVRCCADLGGSILVFGSPAARNLLPGVGLDDAFAYAAEVIRQVTGVLSERNVCFCIEPLAPTETTFLQTAAEGLRLVRLVEHPNVCLHLDVKAMSSEPRPIADTIRQYIGHAGHFHANDANLRGPGMGAIDFLPIFAALAEAQYAGWVSVEVFDFKPDPQTIARESIRYMRRCLERLQQPEET